MIEKVTIRLSENEYIIMQTHAHYWQSWCFGHFKHKLSRWLGPEIIVAVMYEKSFQNIASSIKFPKSGKSFHLEYYEVKAFIELLITKNDLPSQGLREMLENDLQTWKVSYSKKTMEDWYKSEEALQDTFGEFEDLGDVEFDIVNSIYNQHELLT